MHLQVNKKNKIFFYFILFVLFTTINNHNFYELKNKIFKINSIEIYGLKDKDKIQVIEKFSYLLVGFVIPVFRLYVNQLHSTEIDRNS